MLNNRTNTSDCITWTVGHRLRGIGVGPSFEGIEAVLLARTQRTAMNRGILLSDGIRHFIFNLNGELPLFGSLLSPLKETTAREVCGEIIIIIK